MSFNQSKSDKSEQHYRNTGRYTSFNQQRTTSGSSNRSLKKSNNVQGGQSRVTSPAANSNNAPSVRNVRNGPHVQRPLHADASPTGKPLESATSQRSTRAVPKAQTSQLATVSSDSTFPTTPSKGLASGDASKAFSVQFGSISPGFMNGMQVPARTSLAPPNLDEQKPAQMQARHDSSFRYVPDMPIPVPKQQQPRKESVPTVQSNSGEAHPVPKVKKDAQVFVASPTKQTQKPSHPMQMPFHQQQQVSMQSGGPTPQFHSPASIQLPIHMPLPMGNAPQVQQQVLVPGLQAHPLPPQGMMHQGQSLNFLPPIGGQLPPHLSNMGILVIAPQYPQQQGGKFGVPRKTTPVKITHPDTHEELRLEKRTDSYSDGVPSGPRSHPKVPSQSQPIPSFAPSHSNNYYSNSMFYPPPSSLPFSSSQIAPNAQGPRFNYPVCQGLQNISFMNSAAAHGSVPGSVKVPVKLGTVYVGEKVADTPLSSSLPAVDKVRKNKKEKKKKRKNFKDLDEAVPDDWEDFADISTLNLGTSESDEKAHVEGSDACQSSHEKVIQWLVRKNPSSNTTRGKKKRKEFLQKADATGTYSDLCMAYKGPEEKKGTVASAESDSVGLDLKHTSCEIPHTDDIESEKIIQNKAVPDDWEDSADISTLNLGTSESDEKAHGVLVYHEKDGSGNTAKKYSRDFLLKFAEKCTDLPYGFEIATDFVKTILISLDLSLPAVRTNKTKKRIKKSKIFEDLDACPMQPMGPQGGMSRNSPDSGRCQHDMSMAIIKEFYSARDEKEVAMCIKDLNSPSFHPSMIALFVTDSFERKDVECDLLAKLLVNLTRSHDGVLNQVQLVKGFEFVLGTLEDAVIDAPKAAEFLGRIFAKLIIENVMSLREIGLLIYDGGEEPARLREIGLAGDVLGSTLGVIKREQGESVLNEIRASSNLRLEDFRPPDPYKSKLLETFTRNSPDSGRCQRATNYQQRGLISSPQTPLQMRHKAERKYEVGTVAGEEESKQRQLKPILHKYIPKHLGNSLNRKSSKNAIDSVKIIQNKAVPDDWEDGSGNITNFDASHFVGRDSHRCLGRILDSQFSGSRQEFCATGMVGDDRWSRQPGSFGPEKDLHLDLGYGAAAGFRPGQGDNFGVLRHPRGQAPMAYIGGIFAGPMQPMDPQGGMPRNSPDSGRCQHDMSMATINEFYSARDEKEVAMCIKDLNSPSFHPSMIALFVTDSFERKDVECDLLAKLLVNLTRSHDGVLNKVQLFKGFEFVLGTLEDAVIDAPKAAEFLGRIFAKLIIENLMSLREIGLLIYDGGEEPGRLWEIGLAGDILGSTLGVIKREQGESVFNEIRASSNLRLEDFRPPDPYKSKLLETFIL